jgi:RNA polymerase sigma factor (sigma-70 family)
MTEQELIAGVIAQDKNAVRDLVNAYQRNVIKTAFYFVENMEDAEDLSQEVFIEIMRSMSRYRQLASLKTWIYRITVNKSLDYLRKRKRKEIGHRLGSFFSPRKDGDEMYMIEPSVTDNSLHEKETRMILETAVNSLAENQKVAFILNKYDDLPYKSIAEIMNVSVSSVESLIHRAKMNLQKKLVHHFKEYATNIK